MNETLEAVTLRAAMLALDAAMLRQQAHAVNIANAANNAHHNVAVAFENQLERARTDLRERGSIGAASLDGVSPELVLSATPGMVRLDEEMAAMAQNSLAYQAVSTALSRYLGIMAMAVADGRR